MGGGKVLVMEYCHYGSLLRVLSTRTSTDEPLTAREATEIMKQVAEGLVYLHNQGVTHRDLKPANILVRSLNPLSLALSDFGLAKAGDSKMHTLCSTREYIAPDMYILGRSYTKAVDTWALGIVGIDLFMGDLLDLVITQSNQLAYAGRAFRLAESLYNQDPKNGLLGMIRKMLALRPEGRPTAVECFKDADELLDVLRLTQPAAPNMGFASALGKTKARERDCGHSLRTIRLSDVRSADLEHYFLPTSETRTDPSSRAAILQATNAGHAAPVPPRGPPTQKRGTDALSRSSNARPATSATSSERPSLQTRITDVSSGSTNARPTTSVVTPRPSTQIKGTNAPAPSRLSNAGPTTVATPPRPHPQNGGNMGTVGYTTWVAAQRLPRTPKRQSSTYPAGAARKMPRSEHEQKQPLSGTSVSTT